MIKKNPEHKDPHHPFRVRGLMAFAVGICLLVWVVGGFFTAESVTTWYQTIEKSLLTPPDWVFGPVWTLLYVLMWLAFFGVLKQDRKKHDVKVASIWFLVSLFLNLGWSIVFFAFQSPLAALVEILVLWGVLVYVAYLFEHIKKLSFYLLIPYLLWVLFAAFLNFRVVVLN